MNIAKRVFKHCTVWVLRTEARLVVQKYKPRIIAVTGSVGKTSTKDAIFAVLGETSHVRKSEKSFNSEIGLPLTILGCPNAWSNPFRWLQNIFDGFLLIIFKTSYPEWLVLEVGADRPGDISSLAAWLAVDVVVITHVPEMPVHVEFFDSPEQVLAEKASLLHALKKEGTLIVYADNAHADMFSMRAQERDAHIRTYGLSANANVSARSVSVLYATETERADEPLGTQAEVTVEGTSFPVSLMGTLGAHALLPVLAAAAVGKTLGLSTAEIAEGVRHYVPPNGRMRLLPGIKDTFVIDDTYNSSPAAVVAALDALVSVEAKRKIVVLGDMLELGRHSVDEHRKVGAYAAHGVDMLLTVGFRARDIAQGALDNGLLDANILQFEDAQKAGEALANLLALGDCVLVKGSQGMRMEKTVEMVMREPERAPELLVRQEKNWKSR
ncbi:MAG: UDP-N-acetylmuramoyl-tripeptide--D-alanyl-D-alanine ligase [bacterium]